MGKKKAIKRKRSWRTQNKMDAKALPLETRQKFLDLMHNDGKNLGEAAELCGISLDTACGIIDLNIKRIEFVSTVAV